MFSQYVQQMTGQQDTSQLLLVSTPKKLVQGAQAMTGATRRRLAVEYA